MPLMFKESVNQPAQVSLGNVSIQPEAYTSGTVKERSWETDGVNLILPAGAYSVHIRHVDPTGGLVTVNGEDIPFNRFYERAVRVDQINKNQDFTPEVIIQNLARKKMAISVAYPSASPVNVDQL